MVVVCPVVYRHLRWYWVMCYQCKAIQVLPLRKMHVAWRNPYPKINLIYVLSSKKYGSVLIAVAFPFISTFWYLLRLKRTFATLCANRISKISIVQLNITHLFPSAPTKASGLHSSRVEHKVQTHTSNKTFSIEYANSVAVRYLRTINEPNVMTAKRRAAMVYSLNKGEYNRRSHI